MEDIAVNPVLCIYVPFHIEFSRQLKNSSLNSFRESFAIQAPSMRIPLDSLLFPVFIGCDSHNFRKLCNKMMLHGQRGWMKL